ncbi:MULTISPECIES: GPW/gp25 family protein [unclassified Sphingobium]|uniref:GPW/gp25 family protein n=1 Tax=unclassified Sphingobium TaxID=2611147 RepID=UPI002223F459|nr:MULTISPECIES: GPW/gp25 family protein [unclassified Sphingobium]MCW2396172.1 phage baseplate assembly protein W [Sphingobium sp. B8D3B]MCW2419688.1 phage baseplate assembly protein W [Sphingobium sp. B8D3C]
MSGMDRRTGAPLEGPDHIRQSVSDILGTAIGARVGRREYGSLLPELIDRPMTAPNILRLYAATALALSRWEKRLRLRRIQLVAGNRPGTAALTIDAERTDAPAPNARLRLTYPLNA